MKTFAGNFLDVIIIGTALGMGLTLGVLLVYLPLTCWGAFMNRCLERWSARHRKD